MSRNGRGCSRGYYLPARPPPHHEIDNHNTDNCRNPHRDNGPDQEYRRQKRTEQRTRLNLLQRDSRPARIKSLLSRTPHHIQKTTIRILLSQDEGNWRKGLNSSTIRLKRQRRQSSTIDMPLAITSSCEVFRNCVGEKVQGFRHLIVICGVLPPIS